MDNEQCQVPPVQRPLHPLGGLPPEVWEKVFLHLQCDPTSLYTCYMTCVTWQGILEEEKFQIMFQLVAHLLKPYFNNHELLKCRQVCQKWRAAVDETFQSPNYLRPDYSHIHHGLVPYMWYNNTFGTNLATASDVERLMNQISSSDDAGQSIFFHNTLKLVSTALNNDPNVQRLYQNFGQLIRKHGHWIKSCVYMAYGGLPDSERQIEHLFLSLPNLHSLAIVKQVDGWGEDDAGLNWRYRQRDTLPALPHLKCINVFLADAPSLAEILLSSYGQQLECFHCDFRVISTCSYFKGPTPRNALKNLKELGIFDAFGSSPLFERILIFDINCLEKLRLDYVEMGPRRQSLQSILKIVDKLGKHLTELRLPNKLFHKEMEYVKGENTVFTKAVRKSSKIKLLQLKKLGVNKDVIDFPFKLELFQKFPNLEILVVTHYGVTFYEIDEKPPKSVKESVKPFWDLIPSLKEIQIERAYLDNFYFHREPNIVPVVQM